MARTVDLFIHHHDLHQMLALVGTAVHRPPARTGDGRWSVRLADGIVGDLGPACTGPGGGPRFAPFEWQLSARSDSGLAPGDDPATAAVRIVAGELRRQKLGCLVVLDLQHDRRWADAPPVGCVEAAGPLPPAGAGERVPSDGALVAPEGTGEAEAALAAGAADVAVAAELAAGALPVDDVAEDVAEDVAGDDSGDDAGDRAGDDAGEAAAAAAGVEVPEAVGATVTPMAPVARRGRGGRREVATMP